MACYLRYTRSGDRGSYILTLVVFALGLMAKPMLVTLPFVLLLLDYWPLKRLKLDPAVNHFHTTRSLAIEKIPFFVLTGISCVITYFAQKAGGSVVKTEYHPLGIRVSNAIVSYMAYIIKMVWPVNLAVLYPFKQIPLWQVIGSFLTIAAFTVLSLFWCRKQRYFAVGWLWYIGTLMPVIGLVQVGNQSLADRYIYIPLIGLFIVIAWEVADFCRSNKVLRFISIVVAMLIVAGMFAGTHRQISYWNDSILLFRHAIQVTENNSVMHFNLATELVNIGQSDEAMEHYRRAIQINPEYTKAHYNLGLVLAKKGQLVEAIDHFRRTVQIKPDYPEAYYNLALACFYANRFDEAISTAEKALELAEAAGNEKLAQKVRGLLKLFNKKQREIKKLPVMDKASE